MSTMKTLLWGRKDFVVKHQGFMYAEAGGAVTCFKGKVLRSFQRIICSLHTQEPEMKISTLLDDPKRGVYGRIGIQLF